MEFKENGLTTAEYLAGPETNARGELVWGTVAREPGPTYPHQAAITNVTWRLMDHVRANDVFET